MCQYPLHHVSYEFDGGERLTLVVVVLIIRSPIEHSKDLEDIAVAVVAMKLVSSSIKAEHKLPRLSTGLNTWNDGTHGRR
jgi:hypothetical protein